jgi:hypothetical protein
MLRVMAKSVTHDGTKNSVGATRKERVIIHSYTVSVLHDVRVQYCKKVEQESGDLY